MATAVVGDAGQKLVRSDQFPVRHLGTCQARNNGGYTIPCSSMARWFHIPVALLYKETNTVTLHYRNESQSPNTLKPKLTRYELPWKQTNFIRLASLPGSVEDSVREPSSSKAARTMGGQDPSKDDTDGSVHSFICCSFGRRQPERIHTYCRRFHGSSRLDHCGKSPRAQLLAT